MITPNYDMGFKFIIHQQSFNVVFNQWGAVPDVYHVTLDFEDDSYYLIDENSEIKINITTLIWMFRCSCSLPLASTLN